MEQGGVENKEGGLNSLWEKEQQTWEEAGGTTNEKDVRIVVETVRVNDVFT